MSDLNIGQLFMVGLPGTVLDASTLALIQKYRINNFILFARNVQNPMQLRDLTHQIQYACKAEGLDSPIISIDQEGGTVSRLPAPFTQFTDARILAQAENPELEFHFFAEICAKELTDVGINMNLAPVLDVCAAGRGFFMERRSLGADPARVAELGCLIITAMQEKGLAACAKHFPGLGAAVIDPHLQLPEVNSAREQIDNVDLVPFQAAVECGVAAVMTSHTVYQNLDSEYLATLSQKILTGLLREQMGYDGIIITDDLEMGAIENEHDLDQAALTCFAAGADILLICHDHAKIIKTWQALQDAVDNGVFDQERIAASIRRVKEVSKKYFVL